MLFQKQDGANSGYYFMISGEGNCNLRKRVDGVWSASKNWKTPAIITTGNATNHLKVVRKGVKADLYINGTFIANFEDATFNQGYIGFYVSTGKDAPAGAIFDNVKVTDIN
jgi:hypothetical protein